MRSALTSELSREEIWAIVQLNDRAHREHGHGFTSTDWANACGGTHFVEEHAGEIVAHASVVPRLLETNARTLHAGYVEAVATLPEYQRRGFGTAVMRAAGELIRESYDLGALSTGSQAFYARLGWEVWRGQTFVRNGLEIERTAEEDGGIMILRTPRTPADLDIDGPIRCFWREGDVW